MSRELDPVDVVRRLNDNSNLLDIIIEMEDFLDSLDLYAFQNWIDGEIVSGPVVSRYWCSLTLKYPYSKMPDPKGGMRLVEHDVKVTYQQSTELSPISIESPDDYREGIRKPKFEQTKIWLITINIPRRFIDEIINQSIEAYDDEVELEDVQDAEDEGLDMGGVTEDGDESASGKTGGDEAPAESGDDLDLSL